MGKVTHPYIDHFLSWLYQSPPLTRLPLLPVLRWRRLSIHGHPSCYTPPAYPMRASQAPPGLSYPRQCERPARPVHPPLSPLFLASPTAQKSTSNPTRSWLPAAAILPQPEYVTEIKVYIENTYSSFEDFQWCFHDSQNNAPVRWCYCRFNRWFWRDREHWTIGERKAMKKRQMGKRNIQQHREFGGNFMSL